MMMSELKTKASKEIIINQQEMASHSDKTLMKQKLQNLCCVQLLRCEDFLF